MSPYLPPLPPLPGEDDDYRYRPAGRSIITVLADEHQQIAALSAELTGAQQPRQDLADVITATVTRHICAEEQYLYPVVRALLPEGELIAEREIKHDTDILRNLALLETVDAGGSTFRELATSIEDSLRTHQDTCSHEIFPRLAEAAPEADLIRLGNRVELAEEAAPTRPHRGKALKPPLNKVTHPVLGLVDKVRDAMTGRVTYPEDL
jgi:hemerythrin-like domain-containing protein